MLMPEIDYETKWVKAEIAAQIETELAEAKAENERLKRCLSVTEKQRDWWEQEARHCLTPEVQMAQEKLREVNSELASEKARLDWVLSRCDIEPPINLQAIYERSDIDAAMKEESK